MQHTYTEVNHTWAWDHMLRLRSSCTLGCPSEVPSFIGSPAGSNTRTSAPSLVSILCKKTPTSNQDVFCYPTE